MKEYLPSKEFMTRVGLVVISCALLFSVYKLSVFILNKFTKGGRRDLVAYKGGNIQKDTNKNGIADWEESLWGLDPSGDGEKNKATIEKRRGDLTNSSSASTMNDKPLNEDEEASREFFAAVMSLQQSGNLTDASIESVADAIGEKIVAKPIDDIYKPTDVKTEDLTEETFVMYFKQTSDLFNKYKNKSIGDELTFISQGLVNRDPEAMRVAGNVAKAYRAFGKELIQIPVPKVMAQNHFDLANNYEKVAISIEGMARVLDEPIVGMRAFVNYKKYNEALVKEINYIASISSAQ
jgi:hypothetical protein